MKWTPRSVGNRIKRNDLPAQFARRSASHPASSDDASRTGSRRRRGAQVNHELAGLDQLQLLVVISLILCP